jgi:hypothetical protein
MYTHSYYHVQLIPVLALGLAPLGTSLANSLRGLRVAWRLAAVSLLVAACAYQAWVARSVLAAEDFRQEPSFWRDVGAAIPIDAKVIALTQDYGYRLMYWGWRKVALWPIATELSEARGGGQESVSDFGDLTAGMDFFLVTAFGQVDKQPGLGQALAQFPVAREGNGYVLYDLRP